jgi:hypothetical protein
MLPLLPLKLNSKSPVIPEAPAVPRIVLSPDVSALRTLLLLVLSWTWKPVELLEPSRVVPLVTVKLLPVATVVLPFNPTVPVPVAKVWAPATLVSPFRVLVPVPVLKLPAPLWVKFLPEAIVVSPLRDTAPVPVLKLPLLADWSKLLAPPAKVKLDPENRLVLAVRDMPPLPPLIVVELLPVVFPKVRL